MVDHPDDGLNAATLLAHEPAAHAVELHLAGRQRARAELVLQPLDAEARVAPLDQEAGQARGCLGEREEGVAGGIGAEPLVAGDLPGVAVGSGPRAVRAHVRAALLLGHRHAHERAVVVARLGHPGLPLGRQLRLLAQGGNGGVGHRHRAHDAGVHLAPDEEERGTNRVGAGLRVSPGKRVDLALDRLAQAPVPGRIELHLVDPVAVAVVRSQDRLVALGALGVGQRLGAAGQLAGVAEAVDSPAAALALHGFPQRQVRLEHVVGHERRRLVLDPVGGLRDLHLALEPTAAPPQPSIGCRVLMPMRRLRLAFPAIAAALLAAAPLAHAARGFSFGVTAGEVTIHERAPLGQGEQERRLHARHRPQQALHAARHPPRACARGATTTRFSCA